MNEPVFNSMYASAYDQLYREKHYQDECDLLEGLFRRYSAGPIRKILDVGCGTGNHAVLLAEKGFHVTGVDSSPHMVRVAAGKVRPSASGSANPVFEVGDILKLSLPSHFDVALMMFSVLGYQTKNTEVLRALGNVRHHLHYGGLVLFDTWYGPAVLTQRPGERVILREESNASLLRTSSSWLDVYNHVCNVTFQLWDIRGDRVVAQTRERHVMRFFFPQELELYLHLAGFELLRLGGFPDFDRDPDESTWNVLAVARAVDAAGTVGV